MMTIQNAGFYTFLVIIVLELCSRWSGALLRCQMFTRTHVIVIQVIGHHYNLASIMTQQRCVWRKYLLTAQIEFFQTALTTSARIIAVEC